MPKLLYIKQGGRFLTGAALQSAIEAAATPAIQQGILRLQAAVQERSPVVSGTLRRSWYTSPPEWDGTVFSSKLGSQVAYAQRVNRTSKANAGYIEQAVDGSKDDALETLRSGLSAIKDLIWEAAK